MAWKLNYTDQTGSFTVGNAITGATSGATATINAVSDDGTAGFLALGSITGTFQDNEYIYENAASAVYSSDFSAGVDNWQQNVGSANLQVTGNNDGIGGVNDCLKILAFGSDRGCQIRENAGRSTIGTLHKSTFDSYADVGCGLAYTGMGAAGNKTSLGNNIAVSEGSWTTGSIQYFVETQTQTRIGTFTTLTGNGVDTLLNGKAIYFKDIIFESVDNYALADGTLLPIGVMNFEASTKDFNFNAKEGP